MIKHDSFQNSIFYQLKINYLISFIFLFSLLTSCEQKHSDENVDVGPPMGNYVGAKAIGFTARQFNNEYLSLASLNGKVVLLNFWKKSCDVCITNLDLLQALQEKMVDKNFTVLAINGDNLNYVPSSAVRELVDEKSYSFPIVFDDEFAIIGMYKIINIPMSYLIDKNGIITYTKFGEDDWMSKENIERIEKLLQ